MTHTETLKLAFDAHFGGAPDCVVFAPGRVNLIGEHTDYNGGHVMPCALGLGVSCAARRRADGKLCFRSLNFEGEYYETELGALSPLSGRGWAAYPEGVVYAFAEAGHAIPCGAEFLFWGDIPAGAGLSSSAAIETAAGLALNALFGYGLGGVELAKLGKFAENVYVGVNCGIMDQFASAMGRKGNAVFLNTSALEYEYAPLDLKDAELMIVNSNYKHSLAGSEYNTRRMECEEALHIIQSRVNVSALCALTPEEFERNAYLLKDNAIRRRAKHAVYENARTERALAALKADDIALFGRLMNESHISLRDDYEVSCEALDALCSLAWNTPGVIGARMTGGGFGGSMIAIVKKAAAEGFIRSVGDRYYELTGIRADFIPALPEDGARALK